MGLKFDLLGRMGPRGIERELVLDVVFVNPQNSKSIEIRCLVDSGASDIILNAEIADILGVDLLSGEEHSFQGISPGQAMAYDHPLKMRVKQDRKEYNIMCSFLPNLQIAGLLGRRGFFENYKVVFEFKKKRFEIIPQ